MRMTKNCTEADLHVLVVDDVAQNLLAAEALLAAPGICVLTARSGEQALELLLTHDVAVALLDVQMPVMDGFELAELMRGTERTRNVPIIFLTAASEDRLRVFRGYEAGAVDFLHKPLEAHVLNSKVGVFVKMARQRRSLDERMDALQRALKLNETMTAVLAHDLRTPLSAILTGAEVLLRTSADGPQREVSARIRSSGQRMARMIEQLLDFSRLRSGTLSIDRQAVDIEALVQGVVAEVRQARPDVDIRVSGDVREPVADIDADRISQVLVNLLDNAARHGDPRAPVEIRLCDAEAGMLRIVVSNRGELPQAVRDELFTPFRPGRVDGNAGLGLGLYIVDQFIRAHGGRVSGRSSDDMTVFELSLPRAASVRV
jgi:two-component system, sensor histidine kinase and response regulator